MTTEVNRVKKVAIQFGGERDQVGHMLARQNLTALVADERLTDAGVIGILGGARLPRQGNILAFTGVPIRVPEPRAFGSVEDAVQSFAQCDGAFAGIFWDEGRQTLVIATDCLGMQPLYMAQVGDELTLVSETKAIVGEPDLAAWGAFISIGHPIGERSLVKGLKRVPPASILVYDCARRSLTVRRYWEWPETSDRWRRYDFIEALEADAQAYSSLGLASTLLLSGGFDSRLLLFLLKRINLPADSLIVSHHQHQDADGRLAERVAEIAGVHYKKVDPPADFFSSSNYIDYLAANDMGFPSLDLFIAKVAAHIEDEAVWDGLVPGFVFMPLHQPLGGFESYLQREIQGEQSAIWYAARSLFRPEVAEEMRQGFLDDLRDTVDALPRDAHGLARFVIENRSRNRASMNPLKVYANRTSSFTPGLSKGFLSHASGIPFEEKQGGKFYLELFAKLDRRALKVPFLSGGQLVAPKRGSLSYYRESIRGELGRYRMRHPRAFDLLGWRERDNRSLRSRFLDERLLQDDPWLAPDIENRLSSRTAKDDLVWKLLFHWKAWQWLHAGSLDRMLDPQSGKSGS